MPQIRILPEQLANRIAAGEVVERPASVVKELVENSIDAQADRIDIEIEGGGTRLIRVLDNGLGMDEDDVLLSFERHGTSKISTTDDLDAIDTLGFRGEAIPSIASVAKMTISSRQKGSPLGTHVEFDYGRLQKVHETGASQGTRIEVRNLFGRMPARKKFLKTKRTELGHIDEIIKNYALGCPHIAFSLKVDGRETIALNSAHSLEERLRHILHYRDELIVIEAASTKGHKRSLQGFLVPPDRSLPASARVRLFINGRAIKDRLMHHAVIEGLRGFLLKGHSPAGYLHLHLPPDEVDVNVHPAKHEVRFRNGRDIHQYIKQTIEQGMHDYQHTIRADFLNSSSPVPESGPSSSVSQDEHINQSYFDATAEIPKTQPPEAMCSREAVPLYTPDKTARPSHQKLPTEERKEVIRIHTPPAQEESPFKIAEKEDSTPDTLLHDMLVIGQFKNLYILCQAGDSLIVIDQHAAHERLLYEKFHRQYTEGRVASQSLLFPESVELSPFQIELVENNLEDLKKMGFSISEFGGNSYVISAVPALAGHHSARDTFFDVLEGFGSEGTGRTPGGRLGNILANLACKAAIKSGQPLSSTEINDLLNKMANANLFSHCPHGRPVVKKFTPNDIKKWFSRT